MQTDDEFPENTADLKGAKKALVDSRRNSRDSDRLIESARATFAEARKLRETNHFADKFRAILRGVA